MKTAGMMREGLLRNRIYVKNVVHDAYIYSLIPSDWHDVRSEG